MIQIIPSKSRGTADHGWLKSYHTFSFANYHNPSMMGFGSLRVINDDRVQAGQGFGTHGHRDMEIISYVVDGALEHKDSLGNGSVMHGGEVQRMTAGTGVTHSEFNHSQEVPVRFLQIWVLPDKAGLTPGYEQKRFDDQAKRDRLRLVVSRDGRDGALSVNQDVDLYASVLSAGSELTHELATGRKVWVQIVRGTISANGERLGGGDGMAMTDVERIDLRADAEAEFLLFDLA